MEKKRDMKKHVTFVGALHIGFGVLGIIGAVALFLIFNFAMSFVEDVDIAEIVLNTIKIVVPTLVAVGSILGIIGGIGLFSYQQWARILVIVLSALDCLNVPIGTVKGFFSLWALMKDDTVDLFNQKAGRVPLN